MQRSLGELKAMAQDRVLEICAALGVVAPRTPGANYISICNPIVKDTHPSFTIWTGGPGAGAFKDHRGIAQGDIIDLIAYLRGWSAGNDRAGRRRAMLWLADHFGCQLTSEEREEARAARMVKARQAHAQALAKVEDNRKRALEIFTAAKPIAGTPVWRYLKEARRLDLDLLPKGPKGGSRVPGILRYLASALHTESNQRFPAMLAGCVDVEQGKVCAIHRTFLAHDGSDKAPVLPQKKVWPTFKGLVIPIWRGAGNRTLAEALEDHRTHGVFETLVLTEGIEDALSAALAAPQLRVWAFISLGNLAAVRLPPCIDTVLLHRQYEPLNPVAGSAFNKGCSALKRQGVEVVEVNARHGKDLNDTLRVEHEREQSWRREHHRVVDEAAASAPEEAQGAVGSTAGGDSQRGTSR